MKKTILNPFTGELQLVETQPVFEGQVVQERGESETSVMSQKTVTDNLKDIESASELLQVSLGNVQKRLPAIVQKRGNSETSVMCQKTVTEELDSIVSQTNDLKTSVENNTAALNLKQDELQIITVTDVFDHTMIQYSEDKLNIALIPAIPECRIIILETLNLNGIQFGPADYSYTEIIFTIGEIIPTIVFTVSPVLKWVKTPEFKANTKYILIISRPNPNATELIGMFAEIPLS